VRIAQTDHTISFVGHQRAFIREASGNIKRRYRPGDVRN
jgi:hypothetical protein